VSSLNGAFSQRAAFHDHPPIKARGRCPARRLFMATSCRSS